MHSFRKMQQAGRSFYTGMLFGAFLLIAVSAATAEVPKFQWQQNYNWRLKAIAAGPSGEAVCFGDYNGFVDIQKNEVSGRYAWDKMFSVAGVEATDDVFMDAEGNTLAFTRHGTYGHGGLFLAYDPSGNLLWTKTADVGPYSYAIRAGRDGAENYYVAISYRQGPEYWRPALYAIVKYDRAINQAAVFSFTGGQIYDMAVGGDGALYVSTSWPVRQIVKLDGSGSQVWAIPTDALTRLAADGEGNCYSRDSGTIRKHDSNGSVLWSISTDARSLAIGPKGNLYAAGPHGVIKYTADGAAEWTISEPASLVAVGSKGDVYTALTTVQYDPMNAIRRYSVNTPPFANAGSDRTVELQSCAGAAVRLDGSASFDNDGDSLTYAWNWRGGAAEGVSPTVEFPQGTTAVTLTVTDPSGDSSSALVNITVADTREPGLRLSVEPSILWPPNGSMVVVTPHAAVSDACLESTTLTLTGVTSSEPGGENDIVTGDGSIQLRAKRLGTGTGRIYTITYTAVDAAGNTASGSVQVSVPRNK